MSARAPAFPGGAAWFGYGSAPNPVEPAGERGSGVAHRKGYIQRTSSRTSSASHPIGAHTRAAFGLPAPAEPHRTHTAHGVYRWRSRFPHVSKPTPAPKPMLWSFSDFQNHAPEHAVVCTSFHEPGLVSSGLVCWSLMQLIGSTDMGAPLCSIEARRDMC